MVAALAAAVSCARCGADPDSASSGGGACAQCGDPVLVASPATALDGDAGMLVRVIRASAARRWTATGLDVVPGLAGVVAVILLGLDGAGLAAVGVALLVVVFTAVQIVALTRWGRTWARALLGLRTVDDLTGLPISLRRFAAQPVGARRSWRAVTADLRLGRDPVSLRPVVESETSRRFPAGATPAVPKVVGRRTVGDIPETVAVVLDTGERHNVTGSLLVGRIPENADGEDHAIFAWPDFSRNLSKTHALLEWSGAVLWVSDRHSVNGTVLVSPTGERQPLVPGVRGAAGVGWTIELGGRTLSVRPSGGP